MPLTHAALSAIIALLCCTRMSCGNDAGVCAMPFRPTELILALSQLAEEMAANPMGAVGNMGQTCSCGFSA